MLKSTLYNCIIEPKYRILRHILFILAFALISYRQTSYVFRDSIGTIGDSILILSLVTLTMYLGTLYTNIYYLVPRYLISKKYKAYLLCFFLIVVLQISYLLVMEYVVRNHFGLPHRITSYNLLVFIQCIPSSMINILCILGTSATALFKYQVLENKRVSRMEQENIKSELDRLKEQISPAFLSNILNKTATLVKSEPSKAFEMLMKLGQLLRYQLYDAERDKVLLNAELNFLKEYLLLSQLDYNRLDYKFVVDGDIKNIFIPPLLFIPFIQQSTSNPNDAERVSLQVKFRTEGSDLIFICQSDYKELLSENELFAIKKRLELICPNNYSLVITEGKAVLQLNNISEV